MWQNGACYIRVSTDEQTEYSPDAQLKALKDYAKKNNIILSKEHIYVDEGISGKKAEKRPAFMRMIATAKSKPTPFDVILVHRFDRFARSREDSVVYKSLLKKEAGIKVVSITESIEDDKFSVILEAMLEAMAEYYSLNLADEVKKGMTEKADRGEPQTIPCFGYRFEDKNYVIVPEEAELIKFIFAKFGNREMNIRQLSQYLYDLGVKTHRGFTFRPNTIRYVLNNKTYIGKVSWTPSGRRGTNFNHPDTIVRDGTHEPIVDMGTWEKAQAALKENLEVYHKYQKSTTPIYHWTASLVKCGNCNRTLVKNGKNHYQCNGYVKGVCKISHYVKVAVIEELILEHLREAYQGNIEIDVVPKKSDVSNQQEHNLLEDRLGKYDQKLDRVKSAYQDGIDTLEEYKQNKKAIEEERANTIEQLKRLKENLISPDETEDIKVRLKSVYDLLRDDNIPLDVKYKAAHFLIDKAVYNRAESTLTIQYK